MAPVGAYTQRTSRRLILFSHPDLHALQHPPLLVVDVDDVLCDQPDSLDPFEKKPPPDTMPVTDEETVAVEISSKNSRSDSSMGLQLAHSIRDHEGPLANTNVALPYLQRHNSQGWRLCAFHPEFIAHTQENACRTTIVHLLVTTHQRDVGNLPFREPHCGWKKPLGVHGSPAFNVTWRIGIGSPV